MEIDALVGFYERRHAHKPDWVNLVSFKSGKSQQAVQATFKKCSCGKLQEIVYITLSRDLDEATRDLIAKVGNNINLELEIFIILSWTLVLANAISDLAPLRAPFPHAVVLFYTVPSPRDKPGLQQGCRRCVSGRHQPPFFSVAYNKEAA